MRLITKTSANSLTWADSAMAGFDLETTGVNPLECRIVSAAIVLDIPGNEPKSWTWLVNPGVPIPLEASAIHGICDEEAQLKGMPPAIAVQEIIGVLDAIGTAYDWQIPLVIYNAIYDVTVLSKELERHCGKKLDLRLPIIDPLIMDRRLDKWRSGRRTQTAVASAYGIVVSGAHTSLGDVTCSLKLARTIAYKYPHIGRRDLASLQTMQAQAHREFAEQFTEYRRKEFPDFICNPSWPIISESETA